MTDPGHINRKRTFIAQIMNTGSKLCECIKKLFHRPFLHLRGSIQPKLSHRHCCHRCQESCRRSGTSHINIRIAPRYSSAHSLQCYSERLFIYLYGKTQITQCLQKHIRIITEQYTVQDRSSLSKCREKQCSVGDAFGTRHSDHQIRVVW